MNDIDPAIAEPPMPWMSNFSPRELKEIEHARLYAKDFAHGTTGHNQLMIIAKLADLLDQITAPS